MEVEKLMEAPRATHTPPPAPTGRATVDPRGNVATEVPADTEIADTDTAEAIAEEDAEETSEVAVVGDDEWDDDDEAAAGDVDPVSGIPLDELRRGYLRQQDYTQKRQVEAEEVRASKQRLADVEGELNALRQTNVAAAELRALIVERPETAAEVESLLARHDRAVSLGQTQKATNLESLIEAKLAPLTQQIEADRMQRGKELIQKGRKYLTVKGLKPAEAERVFARAFAKGEFENAAPLFRPGGSGRDLKNALDDARSLVFPAHSQARVEKDVMKRAKAVQRASATSGGGRKAAAEKPAPKPRTWEEADVLARKLAGVK